jgi:uncharacterized Zn finger protein (UPF0148 family)
LHITRNPKIGVQNIRYQTLREKNEMNDKCQICGTDLSEYGHGVGDVICVQCLDRHNEEAALDEAGNSDN